MMVQIKMEVYMSADIAMSLLATCLVGGAGILGAWRVLQRGERVSLMAMFRSKRNPHRGGSIPPPPSAVSNLSMCNI